MNNKDAIKILTDNDPSHTTEELREAFKLAVKALEVVENPDRLDRPTGKWIPQTDFDGFTYWKCSECGTKNDFAVTKFCWKCGSDMRKKEAENEQM